MNDIVERARDYLAHNAAESGADVLIDELAAEIVRLRELTEWRPIETAIGNEPVIVFGKWSGEITGDFKEPPQSGIATRWNQQWHLKNTDQYGVWCDPTHYMPLPPAPSREGQDT